MAFETTESGILIPKNYEIYVKPTEFQISERKLEGYKKLAEIKQFGIKYPTKFMKEFIGVLLYYGELKSSIDTIILLIQGKISSTTATGIIKYKEYIAEEIL